jgi:hypothetical protein
MGKGSVLGGLRDQGCSTTTSRRAVRVAIVLLCIFAALADALFRDTHHMLLVPMFLAAIFVVRALPALIYRPLMGPRYATVAGLLQATTLTFPVVAAHLGVQLHIFDTATSAALIGAALLSVIIFPPIALRLLAKAEQSGAGGTAATA